MASNLEQGNNNNNNNNEKIIGILDKCKLQPDIHFILLIVLSRGVTL